MKTCPTCSKAYDETAEYCPDCGVKLEDAQQPAPEPAPAQVQKTAVSNANSKMPMILIGVIIAVVILVFAVLFATGFIKIGPSPSNSASTATEQSSAQSVPVDYKTMYVVNVDKEAPMRAEPNAGSNQLALVQLGEAVSFIENAENGFAHVAFGGQEGYILAASLADEPQEAAEPQETTSSYGSDENGKEYDTLYVVNCRESITLRAEPSTKAKSLGQIPLGATVSYVSTAANGFYKVVYLGKTGYALASYLGSEYTGGSNEVANDWYTVVNCRESITLRNAPSTTAARITDIPLGAQVHYDGPAENGFYAVTYNGYSGYALAQYLN